MESFNFVQHQQLKLDIDRLAVETIVKVKSDFAEEMDFTIILL